MQNSAKWVLGYHITTQMWLCFESMVNIFACWVFLQMHKILGEDVTIANKYNMQRMLAVKLPFG